MNGGTEGEVVVITGASAGLGRAIARAFGQHGARVGLIARGGVGMDGLDGARRDVEAAGGQALALPADVADADAVEHAAAMVEERFGPIDVWVNNAMVSVFSPVKSMTADEYRRVTEVTYLGYVHGTLAALHRMLPRDRGVIVQVGSALAYRSIPLQSAYCAAKHAILGFTMSLRCELLHDRSRVRVTMVQMPAMNTPQFDWVKSRLPNQPQPVPPIFEPEVAADAVVWSAHHDDGRELMVGLSTLEAVYGNRVIPGVLDRYLGRTGYASQQTAERADPDRPNNLWNPLPGDHGAHGRFGARSRRSSAQLWASLHRGGLALAGAGLAGLALGALSGRGAGRR
ncbi:MAG TPA: SDR family oxidoreductase [Gemmatimonadaceae bacterium]|nr:SDR family oxidoreductase [Gemmatimonadaceae bacterium]